MKFTIYSKPGCTYCEQAKELLKSKGLQYEELILDVGQLKDQGVTYYTVNQLKEKIPTARTVPQIFKDGEHVGGFDALKKMIG